MGLQPKTSVSQKFLSIPRESSRGVVVEEDNLNTKPNTNTTFHNTNTDPNFRGVVVEAVDLKTRRADLVKTLKNELLARVNLPSKSVTELQREALLCKNDSIRLTLTLP